MRILPNWVHTPYLARDLHKFYTQKLTSIPYTPTSAAPSQKRNPKLNIYLVANEKALATLDRPIILHTLREALANFIGKQPPHISLDLQMKDPQQIDSSQSCTDPYQEIPIQTPSHRRHPIRHFQAAWKPSGFIYTDGSQITVNQTLGASIVNPITRTTTHIDVKLQPDYNHIGGFWLFGSSGSLEDLDIP